MYEYYVAGSPGTGKSHVMAALGRAFVENGHPVLFIPVARLVERLLEAKRDLRLARELKRLDNVDYLMTSATSNMIAPKWKCSSRSWPNDTSARA